MHFMMQIKFNFNNFIFMACVCHSLAACQWHTPSSRAAVTGLSNNDVISLRSLRPLRCVRCVRCIGRKPHLSGAYQGICACTVVRYGVGLQTLWRRYAVPAVLAFAGFKMSKTTKLLRTRCVSELIRHQKSCSSKPADGAKDI